MKQKHKKQIHKNLICQSSQVKQIKDKSEKKTFKNNQKE